MARYPNFIGGNYQAQTWQADAESCMNFYVERMESKGAKSEMILCPTPGVQRFTTTPTPQVGSKCKFTNYDGRMFGVTGAGFYEYFIDGSFTLRGTVAQDANPAYIVSNGKAGRQLCVSSGGNVYNYDLATDTLTLVLSTGYTHIGVAYGYFVALDASIGRVRISDLNDGTVWDPLQFFERSIGADPFVSMIVTTWGYLYLFGFQSGEVWYNANNFPIPFAPHPSGLDFPGIAANFSAVQVNQAVAWISTNKDGGYQVLATKAFRPEEISDKSEEYAYSLMTNLSDAVGQTYRSRGHTFLMFTFFQDKQTRAYDFASGAWHQRGTWDSANNVYTAWRPVYHCFAFGKHLMGDYLSGYVYEMNDAFTSDVNDMVIRRVRRAPAVASENRRITFGKFELYLNSGNGDLVTTSPQVLMRASNNGGRTWGNERRCGSGQEGDYKRVFWLMNGQARNRVFEVVVTDPVAFFIVDAYLDYKVAS